MEKLTKVILIIVSLVFMVMGLAVTLYTFGARTHTVESTRITATGVWMLVAWVGAFGLYKASSKTAKPAD